MIFFFESRQLSLVAGQKQTLQGMAGRTNFLPTMPFLCCLWCF